MNDPRTFLLLVLATVVFVGGNDRGQAAEVSPSRTPLRWRKQAINDRASYEGCGVADFNGDGRLDIFSGDSWYESPHWQRHQVRDVPPSRANPHYYEDFADAPCDVNDDGHVDIVTCCFFGRRVGWVENPGGDATGRWIEHEIDLPGGCETGELVDLNGDGRPEFLPNVLGTVLYYELTQQHPEVHWVRRELGQEGAGHGVGCGDINGDGRLDIITPLGWYQQPASAAERWAFHREFELGNAGIFIVGRDFDGDGRADVVWGLGHDYGLRWLRQASGSNGERSWQKHDIDLGFSQLHTLRVADLDGDGQPEIVTGKRVYAHEVEPGATDPPCIVYFSFDRQADQWIKQTIYAGEAAQNAPPEAKDRWAQHDFARGTAGTGMQMAVVDLDGDGDLDLLTPGKTGLYLFENLGRESAAVPR